MPCLCSAHATARLALFSTRLLLAIWFLVAPSTWALSQSHGEQSAARLPALDARIEQTSVSGLSAGGFMAGQFQIAEAKIVVGAAIIAAGPFGCAETMVPSWLFGPAATLANASQAINVCMRGGMLGWNLPDADRLASMARGLMQGPDAGPLRDVMSDRVYVFSGTADTVVAAGVVAKTAAFYARLGVPRRNILFVDTIPAGHGFVTRRLQERCDRNGAPYLVNCNYDQAGALLQHIYGPLSPPASRPAGRLLAFDQQSFSSGLPATSLADAGLVYIPPRCRADAGCRIHVSFHGCNQNVESVGRTLAANSGLTLWADTNAIIVMFPQVARSPLNPSACWDWWGYTGGDFLQRTAPQITAVRRMLDQLARKRP